uniref:Uncharacterized protein n=1 Tax=Phaeomonas parva TaxID=124430 RepID=A0A7S1XMH3_9STRA
MSTAAARRRVLRGVVFDMDGTLTVPNLDFREMYRRCGVEGKSDILAEMQAMTPARKEEVGAIIEEMEEEGRRTLELMPGAVHIGEWLKAQRIPAAIVTRNTKRTVDHLQTALWQTQGLPSFEPAISRDDPYPPKPAPGALQAIASAWGCAPEDLAMVGDSPANDIVFGKAAGATTALLDTGRRFAEGGLDEGADITVANLIDLPRQLWHTFDIPGPLGTHAPLLKFDTPSPSTPAHEAAAAGDASVALKGGDLDARDAFGQTPLHWAANGGHTAAVVELISAGADVNAKGYIGATAVCRAARNGDVEVLRALLAAPKISCIDTPNDKMQSPLHFAAFKKNRAAVRCLLAYGASTMVLDRKGRTPAEDTSDEDIRADILRARAEGAEVFAEARGGGGGCAVL